MDSSASCRQLGGWRRRRERTRKGTQNPSPPQDTPTRHTHPSTDSFPPRHALSMSCPTQETPLPGHGPPGPTLLQAPTLSGFWSQGEPDTNRCPEGWGAAPELGKEARKFWKLPTEQQVGLLPLRTRQLRAPPDLSTPFKKPTTRTNILQFPLLQLLHSLCLNY